MTWKDPEDTGLEGGRGSSEKGVHLQLEMVPETRFWGLKKQSKFSPHLEKATVPLVK